MPRMKKHKAGIDGWSEWTQPVMAGYRMACCDCGLVHDMDFAVLKIIAKHEDGSWSANQLDATKYRVKLRARRNNRATAQVRRHMG